MNESMLWYNNAAENFNSALPVGNGRIGGMVYGRTEHELIQLNEDSVWSGGKRNRNNPDAPEGLKEVRELLKQERIPEAEEIAFRKLQGVSSESRHYMPLGNLNIDMKLQIDSTVQYALSTRNEVVTDVQKNTKEVLIWKMQQHLRSFCREKQDTDGRFLYLNLIML